MEVFMIFIKFVKISSVKTLSTGKAKFHVSSGRKGQVSYLLNEVQIKKYKYGKNKSNC
jgi:hypothetical protein